MVFLVWNAGRGCEARTPVPPQQQMASGPTGMPRPFIINAMLVYPPPFMYQWMYYPPVRPPFAVAPAPPAPSGAVPAASGGDLPPTTALPSSGGGCPKSGEAAGPPSGAAGPPSGAARPPSGTATRPPSGAAHPPSATVRPPSAAVHPPSGSKYVKCSYSTNGQADADVENEKDLQVVK